MNKYILAIIVFLQTTLSSIAQDNKQIENRYKNALQLYVQKDTLKAIQELEEVIKIKPRYKDAIFDLGVLYFQTNNIERATDLFQAGARLGDRKAADLLKKDLKQKLVYYDTMSFEDVDEKPYVLVNSKKEEIIVGTELNNVIQKPLLNGIKKSKVLKKEVPSQKMIVLGLCVNKNGYLDAIVLNLNNKEVQEEISRITKSILSFSPAKYEGKEVVARGWTLPIRM